MPTPHLLPRAALLLLGLVCSSESAAGNAHRAYSSEAGMNSIRQRNLDVITRLPVVGPAPSPQGSISFVVYRWHYAQAPAGLVVQLCQQQRCIDVSQQSEGRSTAFAGASPAQAFHFRARMPGQGSLLPVLGGKASVVVNWQEEPSPPSIPR